MSSQSAIYYFMLGNCYTHKEIGDYINNNNNISSKDFDNMKFTSDDIFKRITENDDLNPKKKIYIDNFIVFYTLTNTSTFYLAVTGKNSYYSDNEHCIYELFEDIEHRGIKKLVDDNGKLSRVGKLNLKFCLEQFEELTKKNIKNEKKENKEVLKFFKRDNEEDVSKISLLNNEVNDIQNDVKESVKNIIRNASVLEEMENKSAKIKDTAYQFHQDSVNLEKKMRCQFLYNKYAIISMGVCFLVFMFFFLFK